MPESHPGPIQPGTSALDRLPHLLNGLLLVFLFVFSLATYASMPERIPIHFDALGRPDGWLDKSWWNWLALPLFALGLTVVMLLCTRLVDLARHHPTWLNMPHKKKFLALPERAQAPVWRAMKAIFHWLTLPFNGLLLYAQLAIHHLATQQTAAIATWPLILCVGAMGVVAIALTIRLIRMVRLAVAKA